MAEGDGIQYTTKELLARIDGKIDAITTKLDQKADVGAVRELKNDLINLTATAVRRDGPLAAQIQKNSGRIEEIAKDLAVTKTELNGFTKKLGDFADELHEIGEKQDSTNRRLVTFAFSVALSALGVALTIILTLGTP